MRTLDSCRAVAMRAAEPRVPEKCDIVRFFLYTDLNEAATLLGMIYKLTHTLRDIFARQLERAKTIPPGEHRQIDPTSEEGAFIHQQIELTAELRVSTKALYEWLYHIREDINSEKTLKAQVPKPLWSQLERYCTFRNILVTHKTGRKVYASAGLRYMNDFSKFEILLVPIVNTPEAMTKRLSALYDKAKPHLDPHDASEENIIERMAILYRRLHRFSGTLKADVKKFVEDYGTISDPPSDIAAFLDEFVAAIAPHLRLSNDGDVDRA